MALLCHNEFNGTGAVIRSPVKQTESLQWRHNERNGVSNHRRLDCLLNRLLRRRSKKTSSSASQDFVSGLPRWPVDSPFKELITRKMFSFDYVSMMIVLK